MAEITPESITEIPVEEVKPDSPAASPAITPADALAVLHGAVGIFLDVFGKIRDEELKAATERAGGDVYKAENHGFDPKKFVILDRAKEFLAHLQALK